MWILGWNTGEGDREVVGRGIERKEVRRESEEEWDKKKFFSLPFVFAFFFNGPTANTVC